MPAARLCLELGSGQWADVGGRVAVAGGDGWAQYIRLPRARLFYACPPLICPSCWCRLSAGCASARVPACRAHVAIFNVTAMHVAVVPILPLLVRSGRTPGWLLVASAGLTAALTFAIASDSAFVGCALVLRGGVDVAWGLLANSHAELLDVC